MFFSLAGSHYLFLSDLFLLSPLPLFTLSFLSPSLPSSSHQKGQLSFSLSWLSFPKLFFVSPGKERKTVETGVCSGLSQCESLFPNMGSSTCPLHHSIPHGSRGWSRETLGDRAHRGRRVSPADAPPCSGNHWFLFLLTDPSLFYPPLPALCRVGRKLLKDFPPILSIKTKARGRASVLAWDSRGWGPKLKKSGDFTFLCDHWSRMQKADWVALWLPPACLCWWEGTLYSYLFSSLSSLTCLAFKARRMFFQRESQVTDNQSYRGCREEGDIF